MRRICRYLAFLFAFLFLLPGCAVDTQEPTDAHALDATQPQSTKYPADQVQYIVAYVNGQPYIRDTTWNVEVNVPSGYLRSGSIVVEDNQQPPTQERHACHIPAGTPIYTNAADDTYIFYWLAPHSDNRPRRMIRMDLTDVSVDALLPPEPATLSTDQHEAINTVHPYKDSTLCVNGILYQTDLDSKVLKEVPDSFRLYGTIQSQINRKPKPTEDFEANCIPVRSAIYMHNGLLYNQLYCQIDDQNGTSVISMVPDTLGFEIEAFPGYTITPMPASYELEDLVQPYKDEHFSYTDLTGSSYSYDFSIPQIYPHSQDMLDAQAQIHFRYLPKLAEARYNAANGYSTNGPGVSYEAYLNGDILSTVITEPIYSDYVNYQVYNFDLSTGTQLDRAQLLEKLGISQAKYIDTAVQLARDLFTAQNPEITNPSFYDQQLAKCISEDNLNAAQLYLAEAGKLTIILNVHSLAGADYYSTNAEFPQ